MNLGSDERKYEWNDIGLPVCNKTPTFSTSITLANNLVKFLVVSQKYVVSIP